MNKKLQNDQVIIWMHIPRTGGTATFQHLGDHFDRTDDRWLRHYNWISSPYDYQKSYIPLMYHRTKDQQKQIKFLTGHSVFCNSHKWLRVYKEPLYITTVREPVERLLSSFNYRHQLQKLTQNPVSFTRLTPLMNSNAVSHAKSAEDYDTLYDYLRDSSAEINHQCKFLLSKFMKFDEQQGWQWHATYNGSWDYMDSPESFAPVEHPEWWWSENLEIDYFEALKYILPKFFYIGTTEALNNDVPALCDFAEVNFVEEVERNETGIKIAPYWTIEDVKKQPDYNKLVNLLRYDYKLYNFAKQFRRPF